MLLIERLTDSNGIRAITEGAGLRLLAGAEGFLAATFPGQRYTLLSRRENLSLDGRRALKKLLQANRRLNTAYILKEAFGQLWDYRTERSARAFFTRWKDSLKWQRLHPYQKFAGMIESHWDGIASYCHPENKVSLGLVEGVNNKIRVLQRRAYGYRDEEYLKLKIVAAFLPPLPRNAVFNPTRIRVDPLFLGKVKDCCCLNFFTRLLTRTRPLGLES